MAWRLYILCLALHRLTMSHKFPFLISEEPMHNLCYELRLPYHTYLHFLPLSRPNLYMLKCEASYSCIKWAHPQNNFWRVRFDVCTYARAPAKINVDESMAI